MPFLSRWSKYRWVIVAGTALAGAACDRNPAEPGALVAGPATVTIAPKTIRLDANDSIDFTAVALTELGEVAQVTMTWSATAGSVAGRGSDNGRHFGRYRSGRACGEQSVIVTARPGPRADTAAVTVVCPPAVATVEVLPASATISVGGVLRLGATARDSAGATLPGRTFTWTTSAAGVATVSGDGVVVGVGPGAATISATVDGRTGSAAVTVNGAASAGVVLVGAGDIASCGASGDEATALLLDAIAGTVFTTGDHAYPDGAAADFATCYEPSWGRHKARTRPSPGNHDYHASGAAPYYAYFGANAGEPGRGYYSYDLGEWHIIALNSNVSMSAGSAQEVWLRADLAATTKRCVLAYWHHPRFSSGNHGSSTAPRPLWRALYEFGAEIVLAGHDHSYERFAPQTPDGGRDDARGIRQFVVGTGGKSHYAISTPIANSEAHNDDTYGVLKLTLHADAYSWEFIPVAGGAYRDAGSGTCH